jgi:hypothetical protein
MHVPKPIATFVSAIPPNKRKRLHAKLGVLLGGVVFGTHAAQTFIVANGAAAMS